MRRKENEPPAGGRQNLRKPMPRDTRYKGESCLGGDLKGRYEEHMRKQRVAATRQREGRQ